MGKTVVIAGLGLMGGSMAMAFKEHTDWHVCGWNRTPSVAEKALAQGTIDAIADWDTIARCDLLIPVLYPAATVEFLQKVIFTRNYYTHYDDTKLERSFVIEDIPYVNRILTGLLQYHILKLLGIGTEKLKKRMYGTVLSVNMDRTMREGVHEN